jgi:hypothetical protein
MQQGFHLDCIRLVLLPPDDSFFFLPLQIRTAVSVCNKTIFIKQFNKQNN